jgi:hypothetical protein
MNMVFFLKDAGPKLDLKITEADVNMAGGEVARRLWYLTGEGDPQGKKGMAKKKKNNKKKG